MTPVHQFEHLARNANEFDQRKECAGDQVGEQYSND